MAKYAEHRYVLRKEDTNPARLYDTVKSRDLTSLLQLYAEGADLSKPLTVPDRQVPTLYAEADFIYVFPLLFGGAPPVYVFLG